MGKKQDRSAKEKWLEGNLLKTKKELGQINELLKAEQEARKLLEVKLEAATYTIQRLRKEKIVLAKLSGFSEEEFLLLKSYVEATAEELKTKNIADKRKCQTLESLLNFFPRRVY